MKRRHGHGIGIVRPLVGLACLLGLWLLGGCTGVSVPTERPVGTATAQPTALAVTATQVIAATAPATLQPQALPVVPTPLPTAERLERAAFVGGINLALRDLGGTIERVTTEAQVRRWTSANLIDGVAYERVMVAADEATCKSCGYDVPVSAFPHEIVFSFYKQREARIAGMIVDTTWFIDNNRTSPDYMADPGAAIPRDVEVWASTTSASDGFRRLGGVRLSRGAGEQLIAFPPTAAKYIMLRILSNHDGQRLALGEVKIIEAEETGYRSIVSDAERNLMLRSLGGTIVRFTSQENAIDRSVSALIDGQPGSGWRSADGYLPQDIVFAFHGDQPARFDKLRLDLGHEAHSPSAAREIALLVSDHPTEDFQEIGRFTLRQQFGSQEFTIAPEKVRKGRFAQVRIVSNFGGSSTTLGEIGLIESNEPGVVSILGERLASRSAPSLAPAAVTPTPPAGGTTAVEREAEPNDTPAAAKPLPLNKTMRGEINPLGEADYYTLDLSDARSPIVNLALTGSPYIRTAVSLLTPQGELVKHFEPDRALGTRADLSWQVQPGRYLVRVHEPKVSLVLIYDTSGSMTQAIKDLEAAVAAYVAQVGPSEELMVLRFASELRQLTSVFTGDRATLKSKLHGQFTADGGTRLYDALARGADLLADRKGNRAIIVMTDGSDWQHSDTTYPAFWEKLQQSGIRIYTVGLGHDLTVANPGIGSSGQRLLGHIARATGGRSFLTQSSSELKDLYKEIATELRTPASYTLSVTVSPGTGQLAVVETGERMAGVSAPARLEFILDASGSMKGPVAGQSKMDVAKGVMETLIKELPEGLDVGLRVFGHRIGEGQPGDCEDSELLVPFGKLDRAGLTDRVRSITALGTTPIAHSLRQVEADLQGVQGEKLVILVTDGKEECGGKPAEVAAELVRKGLKVRVQVVGFAVADEATRQELARIATVTGGSYVDANDGQALQQVLARAMTGQYKVADSTGQTIIEGIVGTDALTLPAGTYTVSVHTGSMITILNAQILAGRTARVTLRREGREVTHSVTHETR